MAKPRKQPQPTKQTTDLIAAIQAAGLDLAQLRILERAVTAAKRAAVPRQGESAGAIAKTKSAEKHAVALSNARNILNAGGDEQAKPFLGQLPMTLLRQLASEYRVQGRSKISGKADLAAAIIAAAVAAHAARTPVKMAA